MSIELKLSGQLRTKVGQESVVLEASGAEPTSFGDLLEQLATRHPDTREMLLRPGGTIAGGLLVLIDDVAAVPARDLAVVDGATITLLPAISGG